MILLHNIGDFKHSNYNTYQHVNDAISSGNHVSFDGIYRNIYLNREVVFGAKSKPILFVMGSYVGGDNSFDIHNGLPRERYCDWNEIMELVINYNCELGWHSWNHKDLTQPELSDREILSEVTPPFAMKWFAYPYGRVDERVEKIVRSVGCYEDAWSVDQGHGGPFQRKRRYL